MNALTVFFTPKAKAEVRVLTIDGEPWFVARDVAERLGYSASTLETINKVAACVPSEWKDRKPIPTPGGTQEMAVFSEQGLYFFLARSDKAAALPFQKWIAGEVLPAIRKTGTFHIPDTLADALQLAADLARERDAKARQIEEQAPKVAFAEAIEATGLGIPLRDFAHVLAGKGWAIGHIRLSRALKDHGVCYYEYLPGLKKNTLRPYQHDLQVGRFVINQIPVVGMNAIYPQILITPKGQQFILDHLSGWGFEKLERKAS
jgi:anti-repressor protein